MSCMDELERQIKRQDYWTREEDYTPPKKIVKKPEDVSLEDLILLKKITSIETQ